MKLVWIYCSVLIIVLTTSAARAAEGLPSWNDSASKKAIVSFVEAVTKEGGKDFVPAPERIAVFDNDGTLWVEQPMYTEMVFVFDRIRQLAPQNPEWKTQEPFRSALAGDVPGILAAGEGAIYQLVAAAETGMNSQEFPGLVTNWLSKARHPRFNRPYTELVYKPMIELLTYLREKGFKTFIVSGGSTDFMRPWMEKVYGVPPEQVIGSRVTLQYQDRDGLVSLLRLPTSEFVDDKEGKAIAIQQLIGRRPLLAFGNSDGDYEMLRWTTAGSGRRLGMLVHHTDGVREWAYDRKSPIGRLDRGLNDARKRGWKLIDMKKDWKQVFAFEGAQP